MEPTRENRVSVFGVGHSPESMNEVSPMVAQVLADCLKDGGITEVTPVPVGPNSLVIVQCFGAEVRSKEES